MSKAFKYEKKENPVTVVGKVVDIEFNSSKNSDGIPTQSANVILRVTQSYKGITETSEIKNRVYATKFTGAGAPNPAWDAVERMKSWKTIKNVGVDEATVVKSGAGTLKENYYLSRSGSFIDGFEYGATFFSEGTNNDTQYAGFQLNAYILDIFDEIDDMTDEPTGRVVVRAAIVGYKDTIHVFNFVAETEDVIDLVRTWNVDDTVVMIGRIRVCKKESAGEAYEDPDLVGDDDMPVISSPRTVRELVLTRGSHPLDGDMAYDKLDVQKAYNVRKADMDQVRSGSRPAKAAAPKSVSRRGWDE